MITNIKELNLSPTYSDGFLYKEKYYNNLEEAFHGKHLRENVEETIDNYNKLSSMFTKDSFIKSEILMDKLKTLFYVTSPEDMENLFVNNNWQDVLKFYIENIFLKEDIYVNHIDKVANVLNEIYREKTIQLYRTTDFTSEPIFINNKNVTEEYINIIIDVLNQKKMKAKPLKEIKEYEDIKKLVNNYFLNYEIIYNYNGVEDTCSSLCELDENKKYDYIILFPLKLDDKEKRLFTFSNYVNPIIIYLAGRYEPNFQIRKVLQICCYESANKKIYKKIIKKATIDEFKDSLISGNVIINKTLKSNISISREDNLVSQMKQDYEIELKNNEEKVNLDKSWCSDYGGELYFTDDSKLQWVIK